MSERVPAVSGGATHGAGATGTATTEAGVAVLAHLDETGKLVPTLDRNGQMIPLHPWEYSGDHIITAIYREFYP